MKFLLFNLVVGAGVVYLFTASPDELNQLSDKAHGAVDVVTEKVLEGREGVSSAMNDFQAKAPKPDSAPVTTEDSSEPNVPPAPKAEPNVKPDRENLRRAIASDNTPPPPPPLPEAEQIAQPNVHLPDDGKTLAAAQTGTAYQADEVAMAGNAPEAYQADEAPVELMSARDRHRELDILAEDMEALYMQYSFD